MENRINIAELLRECPEGMELDCVLFDGVVFDEIDDDEYCGCPIVIKSKEGETWNLTSTGCWDDSPSAKCVIFPKGKTTWEGFVPPSQFKDGDVIVDKYGAVAIYKRVHSSYEEPYVDFHCGITSEHRSFFVKDSDSLQHCGKIDSIRLATEEEKQRLFKAIKDNGYKWNPETKTLEKLIQPKFKVGDKVRHKNNHNVAFTITSIVEDSYVCGAKMASWFVDQDDYELVPNKFDITTLKPFDNCKYSLDGGITWKYAQYWFIQEKYNTNDISIELWQG